ncbi:MAG: Abi family protein [[Actinobacillus] rossii]|uniref:Abortive infection bacteriophage resistance protein n=1 Tax=[Actinobacillus] rossii TaxID=123820 RepID=A0A380TXQ7_9PAST|nr:Abi family protein [[Actinobacillus] rossii]MDY4505838.1 Abi family protein [[Actinobacillus] rossii]SUT93468.1 Abortive infection bacteriophage resistance protein [[Actinobacillus] rossii]
MLSKQIISISQSRLNAYLLCFYQGDTAKQKEAIAIYTALQHRTGIYFSLIQEIEVALRNEVSELLRSVAPNNDLYQFFHYLAQDSNAPLSKESQRQLQKAISECSKRKYDENDIISHITFGFWVNLFDYDPKRNQHVIYWQKVLKPIFNRRFSSFKDLYNTLKQIMRFRNRLYHQEIVWNKRIAKKPEHALENLEKTYKQFEATLEKIAPERFVFRQLSEALKWQRNIFFDEQIFVAEISVLPQHI